MGLNLVPRRSGSFSTARQGLRRAHGTAAPGSATTAESGDGGCWGESCGWVDVETIEIIGKLISIIGT